MPKQLNIRSDEAYERAQRLAKRLGTTTTEAVVRALRRYDSTLPAWPSHADLTPEQAADHARFMEEARRAREEMARGPGFDESDLYDKDGLPK